MAVMWKLGGLAMLALAAYGQRAAVTMAGAWENPSTAIAVGKLTSMKVAGRVASYDFQVSEWLKPANGRLPERVVIEEAWLATDTADLRTGPEVMLFLQPMGEHYRSVRETYLDSPAGQERLRGARLFLRLMRTDGAAAREKACLEAWNGGLSEAEKRCVLDAMWETRTGRYAGRLLEIARGKEPADVRAWALSILGSIENGNGVEALVPLLGNEMDCEVRRGLLLVFGTYRVQAAAAAIDAMLAGSQAGQCEGWRVQALRETAQEAKDKITGKNTRPGWRN